MFDIEKDYRDEYQIDYIKESQSATINQDNDDDEDSLYFKILFLVGTIAIVGYLGFYYIHSSHETPKKSRVMGVSHLNSNEETTVQTPPSVKKDNTYIRDNIKNIVSNYEKENSRVHYRNSQDISNELNSMVDAFYNKKASIPIELSGIVNEFYKENSKELKGDKDRIITVKEGDTLALIAQRFYGNAMKYQKIIDANRQLQKSTTLYIGEKIKIPY